MQTYSTLLDSEKKHTVMKNIPDLSSYIGRGEKMFFTDAQEYIRKLKDCEGV